MELVPRRRCRNDKMYNQDLDVTRKWQRDLDLNSSNLGDQIVKLDFCILISMIVVVLLSSYKIWTMIIIEQQQQQHNNNNNTTTTTTTTTMHFPFLPKKKFKNFQKIFSQDVSHSVSEFSANDDDDDDDDEKKSHENEKKKYA